MCNCGKNITPMAARPAIPQNVNCLYSIDQLNSLLLVVQGLDKSTVISNINIYNMNCNLFQSIVVPLLAQYNL